MPRKSSKRNQDIEKISPPDPAESDSDAAEADFDVEAELDEAEPQLDEKILARLAPLLRKGKKQGYLMASEVSKAFPEAREQSNLLDDLLNYLFGQGVEILYDVPEEEEAEGGDTSDHADVDLSGLAEDDAIGMYLREMGRVPLLTAEEEIALAQQMELGKAAAARIESEGKSLDPQELARLQEQVAKGEEARQRLIRANTRLVISIAKRYIGQGIAFLDLIQEGNLGLMRAVEKFDYRRGFRFSTYATWWIRQAIARAVAEQSRVIRLPIHMGDKIRRVYRVARDLEQNGERIPTTEEIADEMGLDTRRVEWLMELAKRPVSLEKPVGEDEDGELGDLLVDQDAEAPAEAADRTLLKEQLEQALDTLSPREAKVLRLRYGFVDGRAYTLEEVGQKLNVTRERIRQIEAKALRKLRHPSRRRYLSGYIR